MSEYLFKVQARNRLQQKGLLKRFSINCYGNQKTLEEIRGEKSNMYKKLHTNKNSKEYQYYFLRYIKKNRNCKSITKKFAKIILLLKKYISSKKDQKITL